MIRVLVMIAVTGFLVSVVTLSTAVAVGGPDILADTAWSRWGPWSHSHWSFDDDDWGSRHHRRDRSERDARYPRDDQIGAIEWLGHHRLRARDG